MAKFKIVSKNPAQHSSQMSIKEKTIYSDIKMYRIMLRISLFIHALFALALTSKVF